MNGDFGAQLDAALIERLSAIRAAADEARARIEADVPPLPADEPSSEGIDPSEDNF